MTEAKQEIQERWDGLANMTAEQFRDAWEIETDETEFVGALSDAYDNQLQNVIADYMVATGLGWEEANKELMDNTDWTVRDERIRKEIFG